MGAGRPKGSKNKRTKELEAQVSATGQTPLEYMLSVFRSSDNPEGMRLDAAKAAAPYVHSKLSTITAKVDHQSLSTHASTPDINRRLQELIEQGDKNNAARNKTLNS